MPDSSNGKPSGGPSKEIWIALIGAAATVAVALITAYFGLLSSDRRSPTPAPAPTVSAAPVVTVEGPLTAPLGRRTFFTIISQNAVRAEWSAGGFGDGRSIEIQPLPPSHQIWIEPTDRSRIGDTFTLAVTVYGADGQSATAQRQFQITAAQP